MCRPNNLPWQTRERRITIKWVRRRCKAQLICTGLPTPPPLPSSQYLCCKFTLSYALVASSRLLLLACSLSSCSCSAFIPLCHHFAHITAFPSLHEAWRSILGTSLLPSGCLLRANSSISAMRFQCYYLLEEIAILGVIYESLVWRVCNTAAPVGPRGIPGLSPAYCLPRAHDVTSDRFRIWYHMHRV